MSYSFYDKNHSLRISIEEIMRDALQKFNDKSESIEFDEKRYDFSRFMEEFIDDLSDTMF